MLAEIGAAISAQGQVSPGDDVRRSKLAALNAISGRPLVVYATACTIPNKITPEQILMLDFSDKFAFADVTERIDGPSLDIIVHSPGGLAEAVESIVNHLRRRFSDIRFIVPNFAKSAATMMVMSGNEILMDPNAELGPIDPQMHTMSGVHPARSIIEQYERGVNEVLQDNKKVMIWGPMFAQLSPSLLVDCQHAIDLSKKLVEDWLQKYMFAGDANAGQKAKQIADFLSDHAYHKSHARGISIEDLQKRGVKVTDLSSDAKLHKAVKEIYSAVDLTLSNTAAVRLVENHLGNAVIRNFTLAPSLALQVGAQRRGSLVPRQLESLP